jgi:hypothetical protein
VFAGARSHMADVHFGVQWDPEVAEIPETYHRANQWIAVRILFERQGHIATADSAEESSEVSGHFPGVIYNKPLRKVVIGCVSFEFIFFCYILHNNAG